MLTVPSVDLAAPAGVAVRASLEQVDSVALRRRIAPVASGAA